MMSALRRVIHKLQARQREAENLRDTPETCGAKKRMAEKHISILKAQLEMLSRADGGRGKSA